MSDIPNKITVRVDNVQRRIDVLEDRIVLAVKCGDVLWALACMAEWSKLMALKRLMRDCLRDAGWVAV